MRRLRAILSIVAIAGCLARWWEREPLTSSRLVPVAASSSGAPSLGGLAPTPASVGSEPRAAVLPGSLDVPSPKSSELGSSARESSARALVPAEVPRRPKSLADVPARNVLRAVARLHNEYGYEDVESMLELQLKGLAVLEPCLRERSFPPNASVNYLLLFNLVPNTAEGTVGRVTIEARGSNFSEDARALLQSCGDRAFLNARSNWTQDGEPIAARGEPQARQFFFVRLPLDDDQHPWKLLRTGRYTSED
jgi:hypothetical protein